MVKRSIAFAALLLSIFCANAEIGASYINSKEISALNYGATIFLRGEWNKGACRESIRRRLIERGYNVVDDPDKADTIITLLIADVSVPKDGVVPRLSINDVYGKGFPLISPALPRNENPGQEASTTTILDLEPSVVGQGARMTGSSTGGMLIGAAVSLVTGWFQSNQADAKRTPGVTRATVRMHGKNIAQGFSVVVAADTPETPDALFDGAFDAVTNAIAKGLPAQADKGGRKNEAANISDEARHE